jgi:hypothetical protein
MKTCNLVPRTIGQIILLAAMCLINGHATAGNIWYVTSIADNGAGTLRDIVNNQAIAGDEIRFAAALAGSTVTLTTGELIVNKTLTISGLGATQSTIVGSNQRVFHIQPGFGPVIVGISGLNLRASDSGINGMDGNMGAPMGTDGTGGEGGGILNDATCFLTVSNCYMEGCQIVGGRGGNAFGSSTGPAVNGSKGAAGYGGAIGSEGNLVLLGCAFASNSATGGNGGNAVAGGTGGNGGVVVFNMGPPAAAGGAVYSGYSGALEIANCTFFNNLASGGNGGNGGDGHIDISHGTPSNGGPGGNGGDAMGGGIYIYRGCDSNSCVGVVHSTVVQNICSPGIGGSGGMGVFGGNAGANGSGGSPSGCGLFVASPLPVGNCIVALNYPNPTTLNAAGPDVWGAVASEDHNLIRAVDLHSSGWTPLDLNGSVPSPKEPLLGAFQFNGGQTRTMAPLSGSPAIDSGSSDVFSTDQIGQPRPVIVAGIANSGDGSDIGAYELQCSIDAPALSIARTQVSVIISWPWPSACFVLQQSPDFVNWANAGFPISVSGNLNHVVISPPIGDMFYRLKK